MVYTNSLTISYNKIIWDVGAQSNNYRAVIDVEKMEGMKTIFR
jgi:hypothetical protein